MIQLTNNDTAQLIGNALGTILIARYLVLEGVKRNVQPPLKDEAMDVVMASLLKDLEVEFYFFSAGILMLATFGKEGKLRELADKALLNILKEDLVKEDAKH